MRRALLVLQDRLDRLDQRVLRAPIVPFLGQRALQGQQVQQARLVLPARWDLPAVMVMTAKTASEALPVLMA